MDIMNPALGNATYGIEADALGPADGSSVISLGDGGEAIISFPYPISNGPGPDFAIFENGFLDHYMELGFVEVSSDGINFVRFNSTSEIPTDIQLTNFDTSNCGYVNNLAGKYRVGFGTPFDLQELVGNPLLDLNQILYVRIIDVVGTIDLAYGSQDAQGIIINDPYPTPWESSGFDLDGVAVLNSINNGIYNDVIKMNIFPNPCTSYIQVQTSESGIIEICNTLGQTLKAFVFEGNTNFTIDDLQSGNYICVVKTNHGEYKTPLVKL